MHKCAFSYAGQLQRAVHLPAVYYGILRTVVGRTVVSNTIILRSYQFICQYYYYYMTKGFTCTPLYTSMMTI
jgi:hypothetical protein